MMTIDLQLPAAPPPCTALPPGFRFHPTDGELLLHYLRKRAAAAPCPAPVIAEVDIYRFDPWELPAMAVFGEAEWYFFSPRDRKYPNGVRPNRAAGSGYWKATGTDKPVSDAGQMLGVKKALVFYRGRPPKGTKTSWIMHEYRLADAIINTSYSTTKPSSSSSSRSSSSMRLDEWVLCRIYKKADQQLHYMSPPMDDDYEHGLTLQQAQRQEDEDASISFRMPLPKPPSISDYLVDYSAVSDLFVDNIPAACTETASLELGLTAMADGSEGGSSSSRNKKQRIMEDSSITEMSTMVHASNKKTQINGYTANYSSMFEPAGQLMPSQSQDDRSI